MSKKTQVKYPDKYFEVLEKFHLAPDFKLSDYEKEVVKYIDKIGIVTNFALADKYDLRPSEEKDLVDSLLAKGVLNVDGDSITLSSAAIKYVRSTKEERKTEKKFRKFLNTLDEKDLDKFMNLVNSFEVKDVTEEAKDKPVKDENKPATVKKASSTKKTTSKKTPVKKIIPKKTGPRRPRAKTVKPILEETK